MKELNPKALGWSVTIAAAVTVLYLVWALVGKPDWSSVVPTAALAFLTVLGVGYMILKDAVGPAGFRVVSPEDFGWPYGRVVALGTVLLLVAAIAGNVVGIFVIVLLPVVVTDLEISLLNTDVVALQTGMWAAVFMITGSYFVGRWMGYRARARSVVAIVAAIVMMRASLLVFDLSVLGYDEYAELMSRLNLNAWQMLAGLAALLVAGLIGVWQGKRARPARYLYHVLKQIPEASRDVLLDLAYTETKRLREP